MRIGIVGTGNMGRSLGVAWALAGHEVLFGARDRAKAEAAALLAGAPGRAGDNAEAARFGDVVVWNPRGPVGEVLEDPSLLSGKVLIDMHNGPVPPDLRFPPILEAHAERLAAGAPGARVVKAFNTLAQEVFEHDAATLRARGVSVFLAGDDADAKATVAALAAQLGLDAVDIGGLDRAAMLETQGDFIRYIMIATGRGLFTTLNIGQLPVAEGSRLGGRQPTNLT